jgi:hypothetical protein
MDEARQGEWSTELHGDAAREQDSGPAADDDEADGIDVQAQLGPDNVRLARELAAELRVLRGTAARIVENYASRVDERLARLERFAARRGGNGRYLTAPPAKLLTRMLKQVRRLEVKEAKGRPKDLARLRRVVDELERLAERAEPPSEPAE